MLIIFTHMRLPNPDKWNRSKSGGLLISTVVVPIVEDDASVVIIGEWLGLSVW